MCSVVPSESETVPVPDHDPLKPAKGLDCAWLAVIDNISAALTAAALMACPNKPETKRFMWNFPVQNRCCFARYATPHRRFSVAVFSKVQWQVACGVAKWCQPAVAAGSLDE